MKLFYSLLASFATLAATMGTSACTMWIADEPKMPKSLLNR